MKQKAPPLKPHMLKSFLIHAFVIVIIYIALYRSNSSIKVQEQAFVEELQTQEEQLQEQEKEAEEEVIEDELVDEVTDELKAVDQELDPEVAEELKASLKEEIKEWIEDVSEEEPLHEKSSEELKEFKEELRELSIKELKQQLDKMKQKMLLAMVREKVKDEIAPEIQRNIEEELKNNTGERIKENLQEFHTLTDIDKQAISEILPEIESTLSEEVTKAVKKQAIPEAAKKLTQKLTPQLSKLDLDSNQFNKMLQQEISKALEHEIGKNRSQSKSATLQVRNMIHRRGVEDIAEARKAITASLSNLKKINETQESLGKETIRETASKDAQAELQILKKINDAQKNAQKAIDKASTVTMKMSSELNSARSQVMNTTAEQKAKEASAYVKQGIVEEAKKSMQAVSNDLKKKIAALQKITDGLQREQLAIAKIEALTPVQDLNASIGPEKAAELKEKFKKAALAANVLRTAAVDAKKGALKTKMTDTLNRVDTVKSLQELSNIVKTSDARTIDDSDNLLNGLKTAHLRPDNSKSRIAQKSSTANGHEVSNRKLYEKLPKELREPTDKLRSLSMKELQKKLGKMKKDMLLAMVRKKVKEEIAPEIKRNIEEELKKNTGERIKKNLQGSRTLTDIDKQAISEILPEIESQLSEEVTKAVKKQAIPIAAKNLRQTLHRQLSILNLNTNQFNKMLEHEISKALEHEMGKNKPHSKSASLKVRDMIQHRSSKDIAEATPPQKDLNASIGKKRADKLKEKFKKDALTENILQNAAVDVTRGALKTKMTEKLDRIETIKSIQKLSDIAKASDPHTINNSGKLIDRLKTAYLKPDKSKPRIQQKIARRDNCTIQGYDVFNRELYEKFSKDMRNRLNPKKAYEEQDEVKGLYSHTSPRKELVAANMVLLNKPLHKSISLKHKRKKIPKPTFHTVAFGAADYAINPITIDGDLSDWGELRHPQKHKFNVNNSTPVDVYMRWSPRGLYFCYTLKTTVPINNRGPVMWQLTGMELFVDVRNRRKARMQDSPTAQQLFFCPFGVNGNPNITFGESGRGYRGLKMLQIYPDKEGVRGQAKAKMIPGGYQVECFVKRTSLAYPILSPGMYLAINHSVNLGNKVGTQWSAPKSIETWDRPDTWGDVLLLGADAHVAFKDFQQHSKKIKGILPGNPVYVEITDPDMNLYETKKDRIMATVKVEKSGKPLMLVLKETKPDSGVFAGSFATQAYFKKIKKNTLNIRGGDVILLTYLDARSGYGEKNRKVKKRLVVGWPVTKMSK